MILRIGRIPESKKPSKKPFRQIKSAEIHHQEPTRLHKDVIYLGSRYHFILLPFVNGQCFSILKSNLGHCNKLEGSYGISEPVFQAQRFYLH